MRRTSRFSCIDQITTLRLIVEQSAEELAYLHKFVDFEKAFDRLHWKPLWKLLCHYGVPPKLTRTVKSMYDGMKANVIHAGEVIDSFDMNAGVKQGLLDVTFLVSLGN